MKDIALGTFWGLRLTVGPSVIFSTLGLWAVASGVLATVFAQPLGLALGLGLGVVVAHWKLEILHQLGHAWAARRTGYPMVGLRFWFLLSTCLYPPEPELPARIHVQRALGWPLASTVVALLIGVIIWFLPPNTPLWGLAVFAFAESWLVFVVQVVLPFGFNDGSTLWRLWLKR